MYSNIVHDQEIYIDICMYRRLGPKHDCIQDTFKSALVASVGIESGLVHIILLGYS